MPMNRFRNARPSGRLVSPRCRGGASSVLRLSPPADGRLPTAGELGGWLQRAAGALLQVTGPLTPIGRGEHDAHGAQPA